MSRHFLRSWTAHHRHFCLYVFLAVLLSPLQTYALAFVPRIILAAGNAPLGIGIADLDGDGRQDLLAVALNDDSLSILRNIGSPDAISFAPKLAFSTGVHPEGLAIADFDGDKKPDVVTANAGGGGSITIFLNESSRGKISLVNRLDIPLNTAHRVAVADFDGDGKLDLAVTSNSAQQIVILKNSSTPGSISFTTALSLNTASYSNSVAIGDIDGDGRPDILAPISDVGALYIYLNVSSGGAINFSPPKKFPAGGAANGIAIGDLNGDAKIDIVISNPRADSVSLFLNRSSVGTLSLRRQDFPATHSPSDVALGDFNRDGRLDVVASSDTGDLAILRNRATPSGLSLDLDVAPESGPGTFLPVVGDIDGDGHLDIALSNHLGSTVSVLRGAGENPLLPGYKVGDHIVTTDRLNLRSCPGTLNCAVLRTLSRGTQLGVIERQGDWLHVTSLESRETGWVHTGYTQVVENSLSRGSFFSTLWRSDLLMKLFVVLCILGAMVTMASVGRSLQPNATRVQLFALTALSVFTGTVVLLNQFGPVLAEFVAPWLNLEGVSLLWKVNSIAKGSISYWQVVLFLGAAIIGVAAVAPGANGGKLSFIQGLCTGFLALPLFTIAAMLAALVFYLLSFVFKAVFYVLGLIAIPFIWIFQHLVMPVLRFLAIPFVWLWENFLREILLFLAIPFVWLWRVILQPIAGILFKFILKPVLFLMLGTATMLVCLFPFGVIGVITLETVRNAFRGSLDSHGLFAQGVTTGFLLLDAAVLASLNGLGVLHMAPPLSFAIPVALQLIVFLRLLAPNERVAVAEASPAFQQKLAIYWESSHLELIATCVMIPIGLLAAFASEDN